MKFFSKNKPQIILSDVRELTPFTDPEHFADFFNKQYSREELFSFARFLKYYTNFYTNNPPKYIRDLFDEWKERQERRIWD